VEAAVGAGVDRVQIRDRQLEGGAWLAHARAVADAARRGDRARGDGSTCEIVVNRRLDVALALPADGIHLGFDALAVADVRALVARYGGPERVGVSTHSEGEVAEAARAGADYVHLAPIHAPLSKPAERPALGLEILAAACRHAIPVLAQGGMTEHTAGAAVAAGAAGVAVSGAILLASEPGAAAAALRRALDAAGAKRVKRSS
jgi:thiamine-phosphate pyrophosphorylase